MAVKKNTEKQGSSWMGKGQDYSRKIWLAGLGVYSKIDTDGSKLFDALVKDGEKAEKLTKSAVGKKVDAAKAAARQRGRGGEGATGAHSRSKLRFERVIPTSTVVLQREHLAKLRNRTWIGRPAGW